MPPREPIGRSRLSRCVCTVAGGIWNSVDVGSRDGSPTASRLIFAAAERYFSTSIGDTVRTSPMLSKPYPESSAGSSDAASMSIAIRSRTALAYWKRLRRYAAGLPGLGCRRGRLIECSLEVACQRFVRGGVGMRHTGRRHVPCSKLAQHLFPDGGVRRGMFDVHCIQLKIGRTEPSVVAGHAERVENGPGRWRQRGNRSGRWRLCSCRLDAGSGRRHGTTNHQQSCHAS